MVNTKVKFVLPAPAALPRLVADCWLLKKMIEEWDTDEDYGQIEFHG